MKIFAPIYINDDTIAIFASYSDMMKIFRKTHNTTTFTVHHLSKYHNIYCFTSLHYTLTSLLQVIIINRTLNIFQNTPKVKFHPEKFSYLQVPILISHIHKYSNVALFGFM